jgi:hypothetical protein
MEQFLEDAVRSTSASSSSPSSPENTGTKDAVGIDEELSESMTTASRLSGWVDPSQSALDERGSDDMHHQDPAPQVRHVHAATSQ